MEVVEDFESRPHKAVSFVVERAKRRQEWIEQKLPKVLPGNSAGRLRGRNTNEAGRERRGRKRGKRGKATSGMKLLKKWWRASRRKAGGSRASTSGFATAVAASLVMSHAPGPKRPSLTRRHWRFAKRPPLSRPSVAQEASPARTASRSHIVELARRMSWSESISARASSIRRTTPSSSSQGWAAQKEKK